MKRALADGGFHPRGVPSEAVLCSALEVGRRQIAYRRDLCEEDLHGGGIEPLPVLTEHQWEALLECPCFKNLRPPADDTRSRPMTREAGAGGSAVAPLGASAASEAAAVLEGIKKHYAQVCPRVQW